MLPRSGVSYGGAATARLAAQRQRLVVPRSQRQLSTFNAGRAAQLRRASPLGQTASLSRPSLYHPTLSSQSARSFSLWPFGKNAAPANENEPVVEVPKEKPSPEAAEQLKDVTAPSESSATATTAGASTDAPAPAPATPDVITDAAAAPLSTPADAIDDVIASDAMIDISKVPEKIGYLHNLGLDYGWGSSTLIEYLLETFHIYGGLSWAGSAIAVALAIRIILIKGFLGATDTSARLSSISDQLKPLNQKMMAELQQGDQMGAQLTRARVAKIQRQAGVKTWKAFLPMLQVPFGFGCFRVMRGMASLPVPGLEEESFLWLSDVSIADPYYVLPVATTLMTYGALKKGFESGANTMNNPLVKGIMLYGLPGSTFLFMSFWPGLLQLYFTTSAAWALAQAHAIQNPKFREMVGVAPIVKKDLPMPTAAQKAQLRMLGEEQDEHLHAPPESRIDRFIRETKKRARDAVKDSDSVQKSIDEVGARFNLAPKAPRKLHDGSTAPPPRLTKKQLEEAENYEKSRAGEEEMLYMNRNQMIREEWLKAQKQAKKAKKGGKSNQKRR